MFVVCMRGELQRSAMGKHMRLQDRSLRTLEEKKAFSHTVSPTVELSMTTR